MCYKVVASILFHRIKWLISGTLQDVLQKGFNVKNATNDEAKRLAPPPLSAVKDAAAAAACRGKVEASTNFFLLIPCLFPIIWLHICHFS